MIQHLCVLNEEQQPGVRDSMLLLQNIALGQITKPGLVSFMAGEVNNNRCSFQMSQIGSVSTTYTEFVFVLIYFFLKCVLLQQQNREEKSIKSLLITKMTDKSLAAFLSHFMAQLSLLQIKTFWDISCPHLNPPLRFLTNLTVLLQKSTKNNPIHDRSQKFKHVISISISRQNVLNRTSIHQLFLIRYLA